MTPAVFFWSTLILKMVVTAGFVVLVTIAAERTGPLVGGLIATLPISAGLVYAFLALDHSTQFLADSALASLAINAPIAIFALVFALLAQNYGWVVSIASALLVWFVLAIAVHAVAWTLPTALALNAIVPSACLYFGRPLREVEVPRHDLHWQDIAARAVLVALLVAGVVALSAHIGPSATGILALFPITMMSVMFILQRRVGGKAAAAVMANSILGLAGLALAFLAVHLTVVPLGAVIGLSLGLIVSIVWSLLVLFAKRHGVPV